MAVFTSRGTFSSGLALLSSLNLLGIVTDNVAGNFSLIGLSITYDPFREEEGMEAVTLLYNKLETQAGGVRGLLYHLNIAQDTFPFGKPGENVHTFPTQFQGFYGLSGTFPRSPGSPDKEHLAHLDLTSELPDGHIQA